jgi:hypothetical protein
VASLSPQDQFVDNRRVRLLRDVHLNYLVNNAANDDPILGLRRGANSSSSDQQTLVACLDKLVDLAQADIRQDAFDRGV